PPHSRLHALYTPSLHDALPISLIIENPQPSGAVFPVRRVVQSLFIVPGGACHILWASISQPPGISRIRERAPLPAHRGFSEPDRSEEHTSELQSRFDLVCRLLL